MRTYATRMKKSIHSPEYSKLIDWLKSSREGQEITMQELGNRLDEWGSFIAKTEKQDRRLDVLEFVVYCESLGLDPHVGINIITDMLKKNK